MVDCGHKGLVGSTGPTLLFDVCKTDQGAVLLVQLTSQDARRVGGVRSKRSISGPVQGPIGQSKSSQAAEDQVQAKTERGGPNDAGCTNGGGAGLPASTFVVRQFFF